MLDNTLLTFLEQLAKGIAFQFGTNCEVVVHGRSGLRRTEHHFLGHPEEPRKGLHRRSRLGSCTGHAHARRSHQG